MPRSDQRVADELRPLKIVRGFTRTAPGSVLIQAGGTSVLCTASLAESVPDWMVGRGRGWLTAEYNMLPGSTSPRKRREREKLDGRTTEIQRLIGRSLRAIVDLDALGERTLMVDCDVLEADGGTRTASITGAFVAACDAVAAVPDFAASGKKVFLDSIAAVSAGIVDGEPLLDLNYQEDAAAAVDMNIVMTGSGRFVEVQGTGEEATFTAEELTALISLAQKGIQQLTQAQKAALAERWPMR